MILAGRGLMPGCSEERQDVRTTQATRCGRRTQPASAHTQAVRTCGVTETVQQEQQILIDAVRRALEHRLRRSHRSWNGAN